MKTRDVGKGVGLHLMNIEFSYAFVIYVGPSAQAANNIYPVSEIHHIEAA